MLFVFRGIRTFQAIVAVATLASGVGAAFALKAYSDGEGVPLLVAGFALGLAFIWLFAAALRAPTSFVAVSEERTRIRFAGFVDVVVPNSDIAGAEIRKWPFLGGLGVRTNFRGEVALTSAWGTAVRLILRRPVRVWLIPGLWRISATQLTLSLRNPQKLAERFGPPAASPPTVADRKMKRRGLRTR